MKTKTKSFISLVLSAFLWMGTACGGKNSSSTEEDPKLLQAPDYSKYTNRFETYAYSGPSNGTWRVDNEVYSSGEDFRTVERYKEYKDAGFDIYLAQNGVKLESEMTATMWEREVVYMDRAYEAGLKIILTDPRLQSLSRQTDGVLKSDENDTKYKFETEADLDNYVRECISLYQDHPGFYGVMLGDEPKYDERTAYGQMYRAIKRVFDELPGDQFIQYNLLPMVPAGGDVAYDARFPDIPDFVGTPEDKAAACYRKYVEDFVDAMGVDYIQYDHYPMLNNGMNTVYIRCLQVAAQIAKEKNLKFYNVTQTFSMEANGVLNRRALKEKDAYWLNNMLLGFGVKQISYFTYWTKGDNKTDGEYFVDGASFITHGGEKTDLYYFMQKIMAENQKFAPVIMQFDYQGSRGYKLTPTYSNTKHMDNIDNSYTFQKLISFSINKECAVVTELYDDENNNFMYMVQNTVNPENKGSRVFQTATLTFSSEYTHVVVYRNGVGTPQKLEAGNKLTIYNAPGEAAFVLPY